MDDHTERRGEPCHPPPDLPQADDTEAVMAHLMSGGAVFAGPSPRGSFPRVEGNGPGQAEDVPDHQLSDGVGVLAGEVEDGNAALTGGGLVDVVDAAGRLRD